MKKRRPPTRCLVLDASLGRAAGTLEARDPTGACCRDFLIAVRGICHRVAWSEAIKAEWDKHQSLFAGQWLLTMMNLGKLRPVKGERSEELREAIEGHSDDPNVVAILFKDAHLIEAAWATDQRLASLDDAARGHFGRLAATLDLLRRVIWVNPVAEGERAVEWLQRGAPGGRSRQLGP